MTAITDTQWNDARDYVQSDAKAAGLTVASWYEVNEDNAAAIIRGIEDGDPAILDTFPVIDLSGQWADDPTPYTLQQDLHHVVGVWIEAEALSELCDLWIDEAQWAMQDEIESRARFYAEDDDEA